MTLSHSVVLNNVHPACDNDTQSYLIYLEQLVFPIQFCV